ncbi:MAG: tRNA lysidine(34) synthetase TilS [Bacteroidota bacterium]
MSYFYDMLKRFNEYCRQRTLVERGEKTLLAVSGGVDSICLVDLFAQAGFSFAIAHCNFQLRGEESDADEQLVRDLATRLKVPFYVRRFQTKQVAKEKGISTQMAARELRYNWFRQVMEEEGFSKLATAHHLNDSVETTLFNLAKGSGISGLRGIQNKAGHLIRPLLFATKSEIKQYAVFQNLLWREDVSNASLQYKRNFVRGKIVPLLREINPSFESNFHETMDRLSLAEAAMKEYLSRATLEYVKSEGEVTRIDKRVLQAPIAYVLLHELIKEYGYSLRQCKEIVVEHNQSGKSYLSEDYMLVKDREELILTKKRLIQQEVFVEAGEHQVKLENCLLKTSIIEPPFFISKEETVAMLDIDKLQFPLKVRDWAKGDRFVPLGMKGKKKISDFMIDRKIPLNLKSSYQVLVSGGEIVWLIGLRLDDRYKVTEQSARIFKIELIKNHV